MEGRKINSKKRGERKMERENIKRERERGERNTDEDWRERGREGRRERVEKIEV